MSKHSDHESLNTTSLNPDDPRVRAKARSLGKWIDREGAIQMLALLMVMNEDAEKREIELDEIATRLGQMAKDSNAQVIAVCELGRDALKMGKSAVVQLVAEKVKAKKRAKSAANVRHDMPGQSRAKRKAMLAAWASGKYSSRDICAEQECAGLNMSFSTARKALIGTPKPT